MDVVENGWLEKEIPRWNTHLFKLMNPSLVQAHCRLSCRTTTFDKETRDLFHKGYGFINFVEQAPLQFITRFEPSVVGETWNA